MERLEHTVLLFCTFVSGLSGQPLEDLRQDTSCLSQCTEHSVLNLPLGSKLSYRYSASTHTFLQGIIHKRTGITLETVVVIEVLTKCHQVLKLQDVQIRTTFESREELSKDSDSLRETLERYPLQFCFHNGKIPKIFPQQREPTWSLNIKRGVLSILQTLAANSTAEEVDVLGKCPTRYQWKGSLLLKTKDLNLCTHRFSGFTALRSVALPGAPDQPQLLLAKLECVQRIEEGVLAEAKCAESNLVTPTVGSSGGAKIQSQTAMKLFHKEVGGTIEKADIQDIYESSLLYEKEKPARQPSEEEVAAILQKLCVAPRVSSESADLFMTLVFELRHLPLRALMSLWRRSAWKCRHTWQPLVDALPACATESCVVLMKEMIVSGEVEEDHIESFLWSLAFIPEPTAGMIDALAPLLQMQEGRPSAFLAVTALVHHFCSAGDVCDQQPAVQRVTRILEGYLERNCSLHGSERTGQVELALKAIGNAGLAGTPLVPLLSSCASLKRNPTEIRLAAIEAFRRIPCAANRTVLARLYQTFDEDVEIRIASYLASIKCPSEELFNQIKWTLQEEKSSQVGSFVWSHLSQLLETNDPLKQDLKNSLPDDILSKEFEWEAWKFSTYSDATFHSASASANSEARLILTPASFIPRTIATNLTVFVLGRAVNLLELGIRLENVEDMVQKFVGLHPVGDNKERNSRVDPPAEKVANKTQPNRQTSRRYSHRNHLLSKDSKSKLRKENLSCPGERHSKMNELVKKFTKRMGRRKEPKCHLSIKIFGNELLYLDCRAVRSRVKRYYLDLAELGVKVLKGEEVQFNKRLSLATEQLLFPALSGLPLLLALNASAAVNVTLRGDVDFKQRNNFFINGYIKPSSLFQISAQMGTVGILGQAGLKWTAALRSSASLDGGIQVKKGKEFRVFLNTPEDSMDIVYFSSQLFATKPDGTQSVSIVPGETETKSCTNEEVSKALGWQLCSEVSIPGEEAVGFTFPIPGPMKAAITLKKQDRRLHQYLMKAAYNYVSQKGSWIPNEAGLHFFMGTPKSELKRDIAVDLHFSIPQKKFIFEYIQPKKKLQMNGEIEISRNSRVGHLELILDDSSVYFIKGRIDLQAVGAEQRYMTQLEAKLLKHGSPIILSANVTKQPGKKMAILVSLINLFKEAAFFSVCLEKKAGDTLKQYSLEGETHMPGILGYQLISLIQQRRNLWSNAVRIKYGLFADAKKLQQECNTAQKLKVENGPPITYRLDLEHEFYCTHILAYNHKVRLRHEEMASQVHSKLEVSYGKHWDEINNKKRVSVSQTFKNHSNPTVTSYFMEFTVHAPEKEVDYRTFLQHSCSAQGFVESNTNFKVQYNNHLPFVAGLQWKDLSRYDQRKWEGTFNMDTPWLYLYAAHKLHQLQRSTYSATAEFTAGKAFVVKGLAVEIFCRDKEGDNEGRVWIHTPAATYLRASTVNWFEKNVLRSQTEVVSLWNQPIKNEIHLENSEDAKFLRFKIQSSKQELNITAAYFHLEVPRKTNLSVWVSWTDHKNPPVLLDVEAQIEEIRKEKLLYQKQGILHLRHLFKLPIPQSFLLRETFTVDKKEKHYCLETKVLINGLDESVQTLTLGYQIENPYICAALIHPYSGKTFPRNTEACFRTRNLSRAKREVEATLKINRKEVLRFLGKYQNESNMADSRHLVQMEMDHLFQLQFPRSIAMNGQLFSIETKLGNFDWALNMNTTVNRQYTSQFSARLNRSQTHLGVYSQLSHLPQSTVLPSFQAHALTKRYGGNSLNGSFYLHSSGRDLVLLEADFNSKAREHPKTIGMSIFLRQVVLVQLRDLWLQLLGKISPSRILLYSVMKMSQNSFCLDIVGVKEQKALSLHGSVQHDIGRLMHVLPQNLSLNGSLTCRNNIHEGAVSLMINQSEYRLHFWNRNVLGKSSIHNITVALTQNGNRALTAMAKLRGELELNEGLRRGVASIQLDKTILCMEVSNINVREQTSIKGMLSHNISVLSATGLPTESSITAMYGHIGTNHTITFKLQGGMKRITVVFGIEKLHLDALQARLMASLSHNIVELANCGVPLTVEGACSYHPPARILHNGSVLASNCGANLTGEVASDEIFVQAHVHSARDPEFYMEISLRHAWWFLRSLGLAPKNQIKIAIAKGDPYKSQLEIALGDCEFTSTGELRTEADATAAEWRIVLLNKCDILENAELPQNLASGGSFFLKNYNVSLTAYLQLNSQTAGLQLKLSSADKYTMRGTLSHSLPALRDLGLPPENSVLLSVTNGSVLEGLLLLNADSCRLKAKGELYPRNRTEWTLEMETDCKILQDLDIPSRSQLTGSIQKDGCHVEFLSALSSGSKEARLEVKAQCHPKVTVEVELRHELWLLRRIPTENKLALHCGNQAMCDIRLDLKSGPCELWANVSFHAENKFQWQAVVGHYCQVMQAAATLKDVKNFTVNVPCDSCWIIVGGQAQKINGKIHLTGSFHHQWPQLLQSDIPEGIEIMMSFEMNATQDRQTQTVAGQTLITYLPSAIPENQLSDPSCCRLPEYAALGASRSPEAINLTFMVQKLEKTATLSFQGQYDNKSMPVAMDVITGFGKYGSFELTTEVKHSLNYLKHLGLPFNVKLTLLEILSENMSEGALTLVCHPDFNLTLVLNAKSELQSEELQIKSVHNMPVLLHYFPSVAEISSKVSYSTKEAEGRLSIQTENADFQILTKLTFQRTNRTQVLQLMHTVPQLGILPGQLVLTTGYQISKKSQILRGTALWNDSKEIKFIATYRGLFPRISGRHDIKMEICHPLSIPFPQHSRLSMYVEHSVRSHRDHLTIHWDDKEQVLVSSSLKYGKKHIDYYARVVHPFNFTLSQIEVRSRTENRRSNYSQQFQLGWNNGRPSHVKLSVRDKSKADVTLWDACLLAASSQLQDILTIGSLQACGSIEQTAYFFRQHLDMKWDDKQVKQNLTYEKSRSLHLDKMEWEAILENVSLASCSNQNILGKVETDYSSWLHYYTNVSICGLPKEIVFSGKHQLNKGDFFLRSENKLSLASDEGLITVALRNHSDPEVKNYSVEFALKTRDALWLGVLGSLTLSAIQSQVLVEGKMDSEEKVKLAVSTGKRCLHSYMGYLKGGFEDGLELSACVDGQQQAALNAYLVVNGARQEDFGELALEATSQSLTLSARCSGDPLGKVESKLNEIASHLQHRLAGKIKNLEERIWEFRRLVQHIEFLYDAAGWPLRASQEVAGIFQNGLKGATQMWRQCGVKQALQKDLPLYLGKIQSFVQQMQSELQKPLRTLKDAYYDVTLKPWDEMWQERTEEYLRKLQALVPTLVKEVCLMEPIQIALRTLKTSLDMAMQQMLSWAEAKFSKALTKLQKPLSNLYSFSARNCSVALRLPALPLGESKLDPASIANYLIEEKLMKPLRSLYNINLVAEYYRFKRTLMESPFEHHAMLMGNRHLRTFDGKIYSLTSKCSVLLAKDFVHNTFTIALNQDGMGGRSLYVVMDGTVVIIYPEQKTYKKYNYSLMEENCRSFDVPFEEKDIATGRESNHIEASSTNGALFLCDLRYDLCTLTLEGWHHGASAGLFGTNDNEAGNELMLPDHSYSASVQEFTHGWQVSSQCNPVKKKTKQCPVITLNLEICKTFFQDPMSFFRNCFKVVDPTPFYKLCVADVCALHNVKAICTLAAAFVHLCERNFVPLGMPPQCDGEMRLS